jgi:hypothetical protein
MKRIILLLFSITLLFGLMACSSEDNTSNDEEKVETTEEEKELTRDKALVRAVEYHNASEEIESNFDFPVTIKSGEKVSKEVEIGGPAGSTTRLDMRVDVEKTDEAYTVTLTEDFNAIVGEKKAISYWEYEVSNSEVKLIDKKEYGNLVKLIK